MKPQFFIILIVILSTKMVFAMQTLKCTTLGGKSIQMTHAIATGAPDDDDDERIISLFIDGQNALNQVDKFGFDNGYSSLVLKNGSKFNIIGNRVLQLNSSGKFQPLPCFN